MRKKFPVDEFDVMFRINIARVYNETDKQDSAFYFLNEARMIDRNLHDTQPVSLMNSFGDAFLQARKIDSAEFYYRRALKYALANPKGFPNRVSIACYKLAAVLNERNKIDSSFYFARFAFRIAQEKNLNPRILDASSLLAKLHRKTGKLDSALYYYDIASGTNEIINGNDKFIRVAIVLD